MANILKKIPLVLLIVIFLALIGSIDVSCSCASVKADKFVLSERNKAESNYLTGAINDDIAGNYRTIAGRTPVLSGPCTKMKLICLTLFVGIIVFGTGLVYNGINSSPAKYDVKKEAEQVSFALGTSSASTQEKLENITRALCTKLSGSHTEPPLDISTFAGLTQHATSEVPTTVGSATVVASTEVDIAIVPIEEIITTEAMTTAVPGTTPVPEELCSEVAENLHGYIYPLLPDMRKSFIGFDMYSTGYIDYIKVELEKLEGNKCERGFWIETIHGHEGIWFDTENRFAKLAMDKHICKLAASEIIAILDELGHDLETDCSGRCTIREITDDMETKLNEGIAMSNGIECGSDFFRYNSGNKRISYSSSNSHITAMWTKTVCTEKCQQRADGVISILSQLSHSDVIKSAQKTVKNSAGKRTELVRAYNLGGNCDCGSGALTMTTKSDKLVFNYQTKNAYTINAWKLTPDIPRCERAGMDIFNYLKDIFVFSQEEEPTLTIPDRDSNIAGFLAKFSATDGLYCKDGFFKYVEENGYSKVTYKKSNEYIKPAYSAVRHARKCQMTAEAVVGLLKLFETPTVSGKNALQFRENEAVRNEMIMKIKMSENLACGPFGWFEPTYASNYVGLVFQSNNQYISTEWRRQGMNN